MAAMPPPPLDAASRGWALATAALAQLPLLLILPPIPPLPPLPGRCRSMPAPAAGRWSPAHWPCCPCC